MWFFFLFLQKQQPIVLPCFTVCSDHWISSFCIFPSYTPPFIHPKVLRSLHSSCIGLSRDHCLVHLSPSLLVSPSKIHCFPISHDLPSFHHPLRVVNLLSLSTFQSFVSGGGFFLSEINWWHSHKSAFSPSLSSLTVLAARFETKRVNWLLASWRVTRLRNTCRCVCVCVCLSRVWTYHMSGTAGQNQQWCSFIIFKGFLVEMVDEEDGSVRGRMWKRIKGREIRGKKSNFL